MEDLEDDDVLTTVDTIDNDDFGITMKMIDFNGNSGQNTLLGSSGGTVQGLLATKLEDNGYPLATKTGQSLGDLYEGAETVNHLFLSSIYNSTGYYEYDSTQNYATLLDNNNFKVYKEIGTHDKETKNTLKHGQFFPYNDITPGLFAKNNPLNIYDALAKELPESDPRKYESLYLIDDPDYYFGAELSASFVQTPSGLDSFGHDIIYEFTGDDDFWLYVDGELVIDLGGIHSALYGSVNYSTGQVVVNKRNTTLYQIFKENYQKRNPSATNAEVTAYLADIFELNENNQYVFKDYTNHDMRIFYMERGAGASNLHMKFNLASVKPGQIVLNKQISGTEKSDYRLTEYGYQIWYQTDENEPYELLDNVGAGANFNVIYQNTDTPVKYMPQFTPAGSATTYNNVFFLTPAQTVMITVPDDTIRYKIIEVGVNSQVYDSVKVNDTEITGTVADGIRKDYATEPARVADRQRVVFENHVNPSSERTLTITKKLYDADDNEITDDPTGFSFRLYLGNENESDPSAANSEDYHVKDPSGNYCRWNSSTQSFASLGKTNYADLTAAEKELATFQTSPNGAISKIPAGYKVEVRGLLVGTTFKVEERESEVPTGYKFIGYEREGSSYIIHGDSVNAGTIRDNESPSIEVHNRRGFELVLNKEWSDSSFVDYHSRTYFAAYAGSSRISVKCLEPGEKNLSWYFDELASGRSMSDYVIREVTLLGFYNVDDDTHEVSGLYLTLPISNGGTVSVGATTGSTTTTYAYTVTYTEGTISGAAGNVKTDTVTNSRHGIRIVKTDLSGNPLENAVFTLTDASGSTVGDDSYVSDSSGQVTIAYVNVNTDYTLTETKSPSGYIGAGSVKFRLGSNGTITVTEGSNYSISQASGSSMATLTIKNQPYTLSMIKQNKDGEVLDDAHFDLYREVTVNGVKFMDFTPISGYTDLTTDINGYIPLIDQSLAPGTYYLKETLSPNGYEPITTPIRFTISETGGVTMDANEQATMSIENSTSYIVRITDPNMTIVPSDYKSDKLPLILILVGLMAIIVIAVKYERS